MVHISYNQTADALSRNRLHPGEYPGETSFRCSAGDLATIWKSRGDFFFASEMTTHCCLWLEKTEVSSPMDQDALSHEWPNCLFYAFPTIPLFGKHNTGSCVMCCLWHCDGQPDHGFLTETSDFPQGRTCFSSWRAASGTQIQPICIFGSGHWVKSFLEHCDPVLILQRKDVIDRSMTALCLMMEAFSTQCVKHRITPATCDNPSILNY